MPEGRERKRVKRKRGEEEKRRRKRKITAIKLGPLKINIIKRVFISGRVGPACRVEYTALAVDAAYTKGDGCRPRSAIIRLLINAPR